MEETFVGVLRAIVDGACAWSSAAVIAENSGLVIDDVTTCLSELHGQGWVEPWNEAWTLTPYAADYLGVHLYVFGLAEHMRWTNVTVVEKKRKKRSSANESHCPSKEPIDTSPSAEAIFEASEDLENWRPRSRISVDRLPWPTIILFGCSTVWTEKPPRPPRRSKSSPEAPTKCSACKNLPLAPGMYCARCCRWHLDGLVASRRRSEKKAAG